MNAKWRACVYVLIVHSQEIDFSIPTIGSGSTAQLKFINRNVYYMYFSSAGGLIDIGGELEIFFSALQDNTWLFRL